MYGMSLHVIALQFTFCGRKRPKHVDNAPVYKVSSMKSWFVKVRAELPVQILYLNPTSQDNFISYEFHHTILKMSNSKLSIASYNGLILNIVCYINLDCWLVDHLGLLFTFRTFYFILIVP